ncbi:MAG: GntR family transcriptional regulator [Thermodesulfobacteriota bacterium]
MHLSLKEKTITRLRNSILKGEYRPGERLTEEALCGRFKVSRTPVREALHKLEKEGFVKITPAAGARVADLSREEVFHIYDLLIVLEGAASRLASDKITPEQIHKLEEYNLRFENAIEEKNFDLLFDINSRFHWLITEATGNPFLIEIRNNFRRLVDRIARIFPHIPGQCAESLLEHKKIIDALKGKNPSLAEFIMREHLENAKQNLHNHFMNKGGTP